MKTLKAKLTSRKFLIALAGVITGAVLMLSGSTTEGVTTLITSILGYLAAEGIIDAQAVKKALDGDTHEGN